MSQPHTVFQCLYIGSFHILNIHGFENLKILSQLSLLSFIHLDHMTIINLNLVSPRRQAELNHIIRPDHSWDKGLQWLPIHLGSSLRTQINQVDIVQQTGSINVQQGMLSRNAWMQALHVNLVRVTAKRELGLTLEPDLLEVLIPSMHVQGDDWNRPLIRLIVE